MEELKEQARSRGLWNLFLPDVSGLSNLEYAPVAEVSGWSPVIAPEAINCQAPDTGNMETLHLFGTPEQQRAVAGAAAGRRDPVGLRDDRARRRLLGRDQHRRPRSRRDGDEYVVNGRKWWISGAADERCAVFIVMGKTDPDGPAHRQQSMVLVPRDTPGVEIMRAPAGVRLPGPARPRRAGVRRRPGAGVQPARRGGRRVRHRPGPARPGPDPPLHAADRHGRAGADADGAAGRRAGSRSAARWPTRAWCASRSPTSRMEIEQARLLVLQDSVADRPPRRQGRARPRSPAIKVVGPADGLRGDRPRDPDARRRRVSATTSRWPTSMPGPARCGSPTARTRCTCAPWPAQELGKYRMSSPSDVGD